MGGGAAVGVVPPAGTRGATEMSTGKHTAECPTAGGVPGSQSETAQGLFAAGSAAFGMGSGMVLAGWLYGGFGVNGYFGMAAMAALGIGAGLMVGRNWHGGMLDLSR